MIWILKGDFKMFLNLSDFKEKMKGKKVNVIGLGISNIPLVKLLISCGAYVTGCDKNENFKTDIENIELKLGKDYLKDLTGDYIFKSPGIRPDLPEFIEFVNNGGILTSEMEVFFDVCPAKIIGITGSDGKTTTTTLISEILKKEGYNVYTGGNIGKPLLPETENMTKDDICVVELSSFQLMTMKKSPDISVITNITPNHLDIHKDYEEYIEAKENITKYQQKDNILVTNFSNEVTRKIGANSKNDVRFFSSKEDAKLSLDDGYICYDGKKVLNTADIKIPGMHNVENYMAAIGCVYDMVSEESINYVAKNFGGVAHRIEFVREIDGVKFYNSSIDSSPNRTINTMRVFDKKLILIAGGKDKGIPYDELGEHIADHVKTLILIGATSDKILKSLNDEIKKTGNGKDIKVIKAKTYNEAVLTAKENAVSGDVVLLSPASTSFDMFKNFEERGNLFKEEVWKI